MFKLKEDFVGLVHANLELSNPVLQQKTSLKISALVDSRALHLCIPEHVAIQLGYDLTTSDKREVTTADGKKHLVSYVGPLMVRFQARSCYVGALVLGDEVLLGAVPMEDMDLIIIPSRQEVAYNPTSPNVPASVAKKVWPQNRCPKHKADAA